MQHTNSHISDEELLLAADGELSARRADLVRAHVAICRECRARMGKIAGAAADFDRAYRAAENLAVPPLEDSRTTLQRQLAAMSNGSAPSSWFQRWVSPFSVQGWAYIFAAALLLGALGFGWLHRQAEQRESDVIAVSYGSGPLLPDVHLTPGATRPVTANQICLAGGPAEVRPPLPVQQAVFHEYGMDAAPAREYEVDHLITPALGGTDDIRNLWPEPYASTEWNAHVKDELEDHLHNLVCGGKLDLTTAQRDMASNWILAYKKYFHADQPLPRTSDLIEDRRHTPKS
jgi:Putative zinc-finger